MKFLRPLDFVVLAAVAIATVWAFQGTSLGPGARAVVYVSNKEYGWYDLAGPARDVVIPTRLGAVRAVIGGGSARIVQSPCPNKLCVRRGAIHHGREQVVCLPAKVLILLEGGPAKPENVEAVDAVTQ